MSDLQKLGADFARNFPEKFAQVLKQGSNDEIWAILDELPPSLSAGIVARLPVSLIVSLLHRERDRFPVWLNEAPFEEAARLVCRLPHADTPKLVDAVSDKRRRRRLQQYLHYPAHSLGSLVFQPVVVLSVDTTLDETLERLKTSRPEEQEVVVVLDADNRYAGVLDLWRLVTRGSGHATAGEFVSQVPVLHPDMAALNALGDPEWTNYRQLPVVDHQGLFLGIITYAVLLDAVASDDTTSEARVLSGLAEGFFRFCASVLDRFMIPRQGT